MTFTYTPAEESAWLALKPMLATAQGQLNPDLALDILPRPKGRGFLLDGDVPPREC